MSELAVVLMTTGSEEEASKIAQSLVKERLIACVNVVPGVTSYYWWEDKVQCDGEWLLIAKTQRETVDQVRQRVEALHSYDLPEVIALPVSGGSQRYLDWIAGEVFA